MTDLSNWKATVKWTVPEALTVLHPTQLTRFVRECFCDRAAVYGLDDNTMSINFQLEAGNAEMAAWKAAGIVRKELNRCGLPPMIDETVEVCSLEQLSHRLDAWIAANPI